MGTQIVNKRCLFVLVLVRVKHKIEEGEIHRAWNLSGRTEMDLEGWARCGQVKGYRKKKEMWLGLCTEVAVSYGGRRRFTRVASPDSYSWCLV